MRFLGFMFDAVNLPAPIVYTPPGTAWTERFTSMLDRSEASFRDGGGASAVRALKPLALEQQQPLLSQLQCSQIITALRDQGADVPSRANATAVNMINERPGLLDFNSMSDVLCAAYLVATFAYEAESGTMKGKRIRAHDMLVTTGFNLAKTAKLAGNIVPHAVQKSVRDNQWHQVHAEQICITQFDAFMSFIESHCANTRPVAVTTGGYWAKDMRLDLANMDIDIRISFDHRQKNVTVDCDACSPTIERVVNTWSPKVKSLNSTVVKNG